MFLQFRGISSLRLLILEIFLNFVSSKSLRSIRVYESSPIGVWSVYGSVSDCASVL